MNKYLKLITGTELPVLVVDSANGVPAPKHLNRIFLGRELAPASASVLLKKMEGRDGFAFLRDGNSLYILSAMPKGAMNGMYRLLEANTDIIWARPDEVLGTVYTERDDLDFVWGKDIVSIPDTPVRGWNGYADLEWMAHNGCNLAHAGGGGDISWMIPKKRAYGILYVRANSGHNIFSYLAGAPLKHPDYYAHNNKGEWTGGNPCFTSEKMKKLFIYNVLDRLRRAPENTDKIYINLQDTWDACICKNCLAPIKLADGSLLTKDNVAFRSTQYFMFLNGVIAEVNREFPNMKIVTLAYFSTAPAPKCALNPNIHPEFAPYVRSNDKTPIFAPENIVWLKRLYDWAGISNNIEIYDYYGLGLGFPRPLAEVRAWDFMEMHPHVIGMSSEYRHNGDGVNPEATAIYDYSAMEFWVLTRLYWNPSQNVEQLRKYFLRRTFRESAPSMEKFYGTIRDEWYKSTRASTLGDNPVELTKLFILANKREHELRGYLEEAENTALHPISKVLVTRVRARFETLVKDAHAMKNPAVVIPLIRSQEPVAFDSKIWESAAVIDGFIKVTKSQNIASDHKSVARLFHDSDNLHILLKFKDDKIAELKPVPMPEGKAEFIPENDHAEIFLCDPHEEGAYYLFTINPENTTADVKGYDFKWNGAWQHQARRTANGWEAVICMPLATINGKGEKGNNLRGLILREYHAHGGFNREYSSWGGGGHHNTATFGDIKLMR